MAAFDGRIVPIEVKAGAKGSLRSLHQFVAEKGVSVAVRFDAALPSAHTVTARVRRGGLPAEVTYRLLSLPPLPGRTPSVPAPRHPGMICPVRDAVGAVMREAAFDSGR